MSDEAYFESVWEQTSGKVTLPETTVDEKELEYEGLRIIQKRFHRDGEQWTRYFCYQYPDFNNGRGFRSKSALHQSVWRFLKSKIYHQYVKPMLQSRH